MTIRGLVAALALVASCGGNGDGGDDGGGDDGGGDDAPADVAEIRATVIFGDGRTVDLVAETSFNLSGGFCSCGGGDDAADIGMTIAWPVERADAPGDYEFGSTTAILSMSHASSRYSGGDGGFTLTALEVGAMSGTFEATSVGLGSYPQNMRPEEEMQI